MSVRETTIWSMQSFAMKNGELGLRLISLRNAVGRHASTLQRPQGQSTNRTNSGMRYQHIYRLTTSLCNRVENKPLFGVVGMNQYVNIPIDIKIVATYAAHNINIPLHFFVIIIINALLLPPITLIFIRNGLCSSSHNAGDRLWSFLDNWQPQVCMIPLVV